MRAAQRLARLHVRLDLLLVNLTVVLIRQQNVDDIRLLRRFGNAHHPEALFPGRLERFAGTDADDDIDAGIAQAQRLGPALGAEPHDRHRLAIQSSEIGGTVVNNFHNEFSLFPATGAPSET